MAEPDEEYWDQPYTHADMKKPGFDPFEAHKAWIRRRAEPETLDEARRRVRRARARVDAALRKLKATPQIPPTLPTPLKPPDETERWQKALEEIKKRKRKK